MKIALTVLILLASYLYSVSRDKLEAPKKISKEIQYGPFTVKVSATTSKGLNMNVGMVNYTNVAYAGKHQVHFGRIFSETKQILGIK